jgi:hypothetical protein
LAEVEAEIKAGPSTSTRGTARDGRLAAKRKSVLPPKTAVDLASELSGLRERLSSLEDIDLRYEERHEDEDEWSGRLQRLKMMGESDGRGETGRREAGEGNTRPTDNTGTFPVSELDKRLARLENALGSDETSVSDQFW